MFEGIIFDFNGVLWWDGHLQVKAWQHYANALRGRSLSEEELAIHMHGRTNRHLISYLLNREIIGEELVKLTEEKESEYRQLCLSEGRFFALSPGAVDLLNFLKEFDIPRTIATASERKNLDFFVDNLELSRWFHIPEIVYDNGAFPGKPAPDIYLRAAANLKLKPSECIVVEDAYSGIQAACAAGIGYIIAIGPRSNHQNLRDLPGVAEVVETLGEIDKRLFNC